MNEHVEIRLGPSPGPRRVLVIGAGVAGTLVVEEILAHPGLNYITVGLLDDDATKWGKTVGGVPILGPVSQLASTVTAHGADEILIAIPSATGDEVRTILRHCWTTGKSFRIIPGVFQLISGRAMPSAARAMRVEDLLRPRLSQTDVSRVTATFQGHRVVVTGAGGSIGGEICRQVLQCSPSALLLLDRYENGLHAIDLELRRAHPTATIVPVIADIGDVGRIRAVLDHHRPDVVFHAAAHKHVPLSEVNPAETVKNNLVATLSFVRQCARHGVGRFVFISSDKAANPCNVMGATKRLGEVLVREVFRRSRTRCVTVRFGNVVGSNGSVTRIFDEQISRGGPVTITDPRMTRYFMTPSDAGQLVVIAGASVTGNDTLMLDMGQPVKIVDLAADMIRLAGYRPGQDIEIVTTEIRSGERLEEQVTDVDERLLPTDHPHIYSVQGPPRVLERSRGRVAELLRASRNGDDATVRRVLESVFPEMARQREILNAERRD